MTRSRRDAQTRSRELRAVLETRGPERTVEAARRLVAERDQLRRRVRDLERALVWYRSDEAASELSAAVQENGDAESREQDGAWQ